MPPCIFPYLVEDLRKDCLDLPLYPKCLFVTALNSLKSSLSNKMSQLGLEAEVVSQQNVEQILNSKTVKIYFTSPEVLKSPSVIRVLLAFAKDFVIKCVDEAHLFYSWGVKQKKGRNVFRPAMQLSSGELASLHGVTLLQTATATSKTVRMLQEEFPEVSNWNKIVEVPFRQNISVIIPHPKNISSKFQVTLEPFITCIVDFGESHLILVRSINMGTEVYFHLLSRLGNQAEGKRAVAFYHR